MKVTLTYDFSSGRIDDFSKDKAKIEMSYDEWTELTDTLLKCAIELVGKKESLEAMKVYKDLRKVEVETKN